MKITDMNLICLEECFEHLELGDLLSVADANKRLRRAAEFVYIRKYGGKCVYFDAVKRQNVRSIENNSYIEQLIFRDLKTSLQLLRCFGHVIKKFRLDTVGDELELLLLNALNEFCAETLIKAKLESYCDSYAYVSVFTKPFTKLQELEMINCRFTKNGEFNRIFPKMKRFKYDTNIIDNYECLVDHYPHLEDFNIIFYTRKCVPVPMRENIAAILRLNPQLKKLSLRVQSGEDHQLDGTTYFDEDTFRSLMEPMRNLEELRLAGSALIPNFTGPKIHLKNVKTFGICYLKIKFPFLFDRLECFGFSCVDELTADVYDFIEQYPTINTLDIRTLVGDVSNINVTRLAEALPMLKNIWVHFFLDVISVEDVLSLVSSFKLVKKFDLISTKDRTVLHDELRARLGSEWQISFKKINSIMSSLTLKRCDYPNVNDLKISTPN